MQDAISNALLGSHSGLTIGVLGFVGSLLLALGPLSGMAIRRARLRANSGKVVLDPPVAAAVERWLLRHETSAIMLEHRLTNAGIIFLLLSFGLLTVSELSALLSPAATCSLVPVEPVGSYAYSCTDA